MKPNITIKWRTKSGDIINVRDMSDQHIDNSVACLRKQKFIDVNSMRVLSDEIERRKEAHHKLFLSQTEICKCGGTMVVIIPNDEELGFGPRKYAFSCSSCPAISTWIEKPEFPIKNIPTYYECGEI